MNFHVLTTINNALLTHILKIDRKNNLFITLHTVANESSLVIFNIITYYHDETDPYYI